MPDFPLQSVIPTVLVHNVMDGTDVAICAPMRVADLNQLPEGTALLPCPLCMYITMKLAS